eukprot:3113801-Rhodomonas_salina.1
MEDVVGPGGDELGGVCPAVLVLLGCQCLAHTQDDRVACVQKFFEEGHDTELANLLQREGRGELPNLISDDGVDGEDGPIPKSIFIAQRSRLHQQPLVLHRNAVLLEEQREQHRYIRLQTHQPLTPLNIRRLAQLLRCDPTLDSHGSPCLGVHLDQKRCLACCGEKFTNNAETGCEGRQDRSSLDAAQEVPKEVRLGPGL